LSDALALFNAGVAGEPGARGAERSVLLFPWELATGAGLRDALAAITIPDVERVGVVIGPEGGFDGEEADMIIASGGIPVSLGKRILRTETAGLVVAAVIMYEFGELG